MFRRFIIFFYMLTCIVTSAQIISPDNQADYLIISPPQFKEDLQPLVNLREKDGLKVKVINLDDIYSEYPDLVPQSAIRQFISYTLQYWENPKPHYILLIGDTDILPAYHVKSMFSGVSGYSEDTVAVDDWFVTNSYEKDKYPDAAIGRLPVKNSRQLSNVISKIISFENVECRDEYKEDVFFISDKTDAYFFEAETDRLNKLCTTAGFITKRIDLREDSDFAGTKENIFSELNNGAVFTNYYGHGAPKLWSRYSIFSMDDFDSLFHSTIPAVYTSLACSQNFDIKDDSSIVEELVLFPKGGAVATIAPAGIGMSNDGSSFVSRFYELILKTPGMTIGDAVQEVKRETLNVLLPDDAICRRFTILGDPATKIPPKSALADVISSDKPRAVHFSQNYPNPFNSSTVIKYNLTETTTISLKVFDSLGRLIHTLIDNEVKNSGNYNVTFDASSLSSGIYFYELEENNSRQTKKMILLR